VDRVLLVPDLDGRRRLDDEGKLVADEVLIRIDLVINEATNAICEVRLDGIPAWIGHGICVLDILRKLVCPFSNKSDA
jgi:hypothetical protein